MARWERGVVEGEGACQGGKEGVGGGRGQGGRGGGRGTWLGEGRVGGGGIWGGKGHSGDEAFVAPAGGQGGWGHEKVVDKGRGGRVGWVGGVVVVGHTRSYCCYCLCHCLPCYSLCPCCYCCFCLCRCPPCYCCLLKHTCSCSYRPPPGCTGQCDSGPCLP